MPNSVDNATPEVLIRIAREGERHVESLRAAVSAGDYRAAVDVICRGWFELLGQQPATQQILSTVPTQIVMAQPLLATFLGLTYFVSPFQRGRALRLLVTAVRAARSENREVDMVDRALIRTGEAVAFRLLGLSDRGVPAAREALRMLDDLDETGRAKIGQLTRVYAHLGTTLHAAGRVEEAMAAYERGLAEGPPDSPSPGFGNLAMLAGLHALRGDLPEAEAHLEYARTGGWTDLQRSMYAGTFYRVAEAVAALERFDAETARQHLGAMVHDRRTIEHWAAIAQIEAWTGLVAGRPGDALARLEEIVAARGAEARSRVARRQLCGARVLVQLALGNVDAAAALLRHDGGRGADVRVHRARIDLVMGRNGSALAEVRALAGAHLSARLRAEALAIETAVHLRLPHSVRAPHLSQQLGALLTSTRQRLPLALIPADDLERVIAALDAAGYGELVRAVPLRSVLAPMGSQPGLTRRELEVLAELVHTSSAPAIAAALHVSPNTVKTQLKSVYRKLGVNSREDAVAVALALHLISDDRRVD
ncbi:helix-turn-helix transcriptional regulator [Microbacterium album]|uniref:helix-turn-helix transcriptional regulator n=1 Tax=Microbacterium album TaxID=2053191 RepID=UPI001E4476F9|nr:LuxR family transcriptional regulator [Microbacterium album]